MALAGHSKVEESTCSALCSQRDAMGMPWVSADTAQVGNRALPCRSLLPQPMGFSVMHQRIPSPEQGTAKSRIHLLREPWRNAVPFWHVTAAQLLTPTLGHSFLMPTHRPAVPQPSAAGLGASMVLGQGSELQRLGWNTKDLKGTLYEVHGP